MEQFNETPLQGILGTDNGKLFYILQIEKVSDLVKLRGDLINAINALNRLLSGFMKYDNDHYEAMDIALSSTMKVLKNK